jgi:hypothetical protein
MRIKAQRMRRLTFFQLLIIHLLLFESHFSKGPDLLDERGDSTAVKVRSQGEAWKVRPGNSPTPVANRTWKICMLY